MVKLTLSQAFWFCSWAKAVPLALTMRFVFITQTPLSASNCTGTSLPSRGAIWLALIFKEAMALYCSISAWDGETLGMIIAPKP